MSIAWTAPAHVDSDYHNHVTTTVNQNISLYQNSILCHNHFTPSPMEGRIMIVTLRRAREAMDAGASGAFLHRTRTPKRTTKSCGPGAATLALRWQEVSCR